MIIDGEEFKLSLYADDTTLFSNGSPESLDGILRELNYICRLIRTKIFFSKTKLVWLGRNQFSKEVFHHPKCKSEWENKILDFLGILKILHESY